MRRLVLNYLVIAVLAAFISCDKNAENVDGDDNVQLPKIVTYSVGNYDKYEYDNQNRIIKILKYRNHENLLPKEILYETQTFTYSGNDFVKVVAESKGPYSIEFSKSEDTINITRKSYDGAIFQTATMDLNNDEYPTKCVLSYTDGRTSQVSIYQFQEGNLTNSSFEGIYGGVTQSGNFEYKYDNEKSPFFHCKTPKWCMVYLYYDISKNNVVDINGSTKYEYEYISGFPIKCTMKYSDGEEYVTEYKY